MRSRRYPQTMTSQPGAPIDKLLETLQERAKELNCLYRVHELLDRPEASLDEVCRGLVETLPSGWQYPAVCWARVTLEGVDENRVNQLASELADVVRNELAGPELRQA